MFTNVNPKSHRQHIGSQTRNRGPRDGARCRAPLHRSTGDSHRHAPDVELYSSTALQGALHLYSSTALYTVHPLHPRPSLRSFYGICAPFVPRPLPWKEKKHRRRQIHFVYIRRYIRCGRFSFAITARLVLALPAPPRLIIIGRPSFFSFARRRATWLLCDTRNRFLSRDRSLLLALSHLASLDNARPARCAIDSWRAPLAPQPRSLTSASFFPPSHPLLPFFRPRHLDAASAVAALRAAAAGHVRRWRGRPGGGGGAARCVGAGRPLGRAGRGSGP